ncbi:MAG: hypothetical protein MAG431_00931 [Chloroflexi bacterium]|nr:hypothetical protein [Chloroflexota bacterium]
MTKKEKTTPLVAVGWDGATWDLVHPWVEEGKLPHIASLMESGSYGLLQSKPIPVSPAAWTTIITGQNPGKHGVFDWFSRRPGQYSVEYVHTGKIRTRSLWEYVNQAGKRVGISNLPMIYPAVPVESFMLSGMAAPSPNAEGFAYPPGLLAELEEEVGPYQVIEEKVYKYGREAEYLRSLLDWSAYQEKTIHYLIENHPCDVYLLVFMQTDHAQHKLWRYLDESRPDYDANHDRQYRDSIFKVYQTIDEILGRLVRKFGEANYLVFSDHGAGPMYGVMHLNQWLHEEGLLYMKESPATLLKRGLAKTNIIMRIFDFVAKIGLGSVANLFPKPLRNKLVNSFFTFENINWKRTKAYARGSFGQIYINLKGREPQGIVEPGPGYEETCQDIIKKLKKLKHPDTGQPLITDIKHAQDVYDGPHQDKAADILFSIQNYRYQTSVKLGIEHDDLLGPSEYGDSGAHREEGMLVLSGPDIRQGQRITSAQLEDVLPTMLTLADIPIPSSLDGDPLEEVFDHQRRQRIRFLEKDEEGRPAEPEEEDSPDMSDEEVSALEDRLRDLGYLG